MRPTTGNRKRSATPGPPAKPRWQRALAITCAVLALGGALDFLFRSQRPDTMPAAHGAIFEASGRAAAEQIMEFLGGRGRLVVLTGNHGSARSPVQESFLRGFQAAAQARPGVTIAAVEWITPNHLGIPAATFLPLLQRHARADALVSFVGAPVLQDDDLHRLPAQRPKLIVLSGAPAVTHRLLGKKIVDAALVPAGPGSPDAAPGTHPAFRVVTPATMPAQAPEEPQP